MATSRQGPLRQLDRRQEETWSSLELAPSRDEILFYVDLTCIFDMAHRCSPCFGVGVALFLAACEESPADFVLTQELLRTRTDCRIAREGKRAAVMRSTRRRHDVGSIGTNGMGENF